MICPSQPMSQSSCSDGVDSDSTFGRTRKKIGVTYAKSWVSRTDSRAGFRYLETFSRAPKSAWNLPRSSFEMRVHSDVAKVSVSPGQRRESSAAASNPALSSSSFLRESLWRDLWGALIETDLSFELWGRRERRDAREVALKRSIKILINERGSLAT